ncbi:MAG: L-glutamate gamma-semialdehyde dehydrogenase [Acholeplasmataceae bacterium]|jgi:1-pyrroline-5-carboxylate dehydrogenase|nr:L-glutamate gamma-semialdehyde dehydrogenase [Acholeplasmataceae bacterium]
MAIYPYQTEPLVDYSQAENKKHYLEALEKVGKEIGGDYPLIIGGERIETGKLLDSRNPAKHSQLIGRTHQAGLQEAEAAMQCAQKAFQTWSKTDPSYRADILFKAAAIYRRKRFELNALETLEAGKPWIEADADVAEAIDFLEYYGRQILEIQRVDDKVLSRRNLERNEYRYIPLGVGAIITPWNFPLAILTGMTSAAIVSGNTVLLKPSSNTSVIAFRFLEMMEEAGLPAGVINLVPGKGSEIGDYLVNHPKTRFISFTGSKDVGVEIYEKAAKVQKGQIWLKRVISEMGGKDAIVVDNNIDTDFVASEIVKSAFGFSGQKCSACSRAIIHQDVYDEVLEKIVEKAKVLKVGDPSLFDTNVGPVIDEKAFRRISEYIRIGNGEGRLVAGGLTDASTGWFIEPTVIADCSPNARIMQEEIFGPVLAVTKVKDFEEALAAANNSEYGLTGSVFSRNREHLERARADFAVGNLYLNRKCTGAIVGYQPFGGFNMSGTDSKAGGPEYLLLHMQAKSISEQF